MRTHSFMNKLFVPALLASVVFGNMVSAASIKIDEVATNPHSLVFDIVWGETAPPIRGSASSFSDYNIGTYDYTSELQINVTGPPEVVPNKGDIVFFVQFPAKSRAYEHASVTTTGLLPELKSITATPDGYGARIEYANPAQNNTSVPDGGSTFCLLGIAAAGLVAWRWGKKDRAV